jgi:hypothetical protein
MEGCCGALLQLVVYGFLRTSGTACGVFLEAPFAEADDALGASLMFSSLNGSSTPTYGSFATPVAAIGLTMNALPSAGGKMTATILQAGIG